jgi:Transposase DDE domain group 1
LFPDLFAKPLVAAFDQPHGSSDGGAVLLKAADRRVGLSNALAAQPADTRAPPKVTLAIEDLLARRVFAIACGHTDGNDAYQLKGRGF